MPQVTAFSGSRHEALCADCHKPATDLIEYVSYRVGDVVCSLHRIARANSLGRRIERTTQLRYADTIKLVT